MAGNLLIFVMNNTTKLFKVLLTIIAVVFFISSFPFNSPDCNLDESWRLAINMAINQNLNFGKQFAFTYGPLGYIATRETVYLNVWQFFIFDMLIIFLLTRLVIYVLDTFKSPIKYVFIIGSFLCFSTWGGIFAEEIQTLFFIVILFEFYRYITEKNKLSLPIITLLSVIGLYIKVNYCLLFILVYVFLIVSLLILKYLKITHFIAWIIIYTIAIVSSNLILNVSFYEYVLNSLYLIDSYNDAMYSIPDANIFAWYMSFAGVAVVSLVSVGIYLIYVWLKEKSNFYDIAPNLILFSIIVGLTFVIYKQTVVNGHIFVFPKVYLPLIAVSFLFIKHKHFAVYFTNLLIAILLYFGYYNLVKHKEIFGHSDFLSSFSVEHQNKKIKSLFQYPIQFKKSQKLKYTQSCVTLDQKIADEVGKNTFDVYPWEISVAYTNQLNYAPRPLIQSYSAHHGKLDLLNSENLFSDKGAKYLLFQAHSLGDRHLLAEENYTKLAMMMNYSFTGLTQPDFFAPFLLLKKKERLFQFNDIKQETIISTTLGLGHSFELPVTDSLLILKLEWPYSWKGKLKRTLYMPPPLQIEVTLENDTKRTFRLVNSITKEGIVINKWVDYMQNSSEMLHYFKYFGKYNKKIKSFRVISEEEWGVESEANIVIKKVSFHQDVKMEAPVLDEVNIVTSNEPISGQITMLDTTGNSILIKGFAYTANNNQGCCNDIKILIKDKNNKYFATETHVGTYYQHLQSANLDQRYSRVYFNALIPKDLLKQNDIEYYLGINNVKNTWSIVKVNI